MVANVYILPRHSGCNLRRFPEKYNMTFDVIWFMKLCINGYFNDINFTQVAVKLATIFLLHKSLEIQYDVIFYEKWRPKCKHWLPFCEHMTSNWIPREVMKRGIKPYFCAILQYHIYALAKFHSAISALRYRRRGQLRQDPAKKKSCHHQYTEGFPRDKRKKTEMKRTLNGDRTIFIAQYAISLKLRQDLSNVIKMEMVAK